MNRASYTVNMNDTVIVNMNDTVTVNVNDTVSENLNRQYSDCLINVTVCESDIIMKVILLL